MIDTQATEKSYRYVIGAVCFCIQAIGIGIFVSYGVFFSSLHEEFGWSRTIISGASSLAFFLMGFFAIFVGRLNDRVGPRKLMIVTSCFVGLGFLLMSRLQTSWQLYLFYGIAVGIGFSSIDVISLSTTTRWFVRNRGMVTGMVKVGTGAGQLVVPLIASLLITNYGWRTAYVVIGITGMISLALLGWLLRRDPGQVVESAVDKKDVQSLSLGQAIRTIQFWILCVVNFSVVFCLLIVLVHIVPFAQDLHISSAKAAGVISTIGGVSMVGRFATGIFIDRFDSRKATILCFILLISTLLWLQITNNLWMIYLFAAFYGLAHGGFFTAISPIVAEYFGIRSHGVLFGLIVFSGCLGGSVGPILAGYIFDTTGGYSPAFWLSTLVALTGLGFIIFLKPVKKIKDRSNLDGSSCLPG